MGYYEHAYVHACLQSYSRFKIKRRIKTIKTIAQFNWSIGIMMYFTRTGCEKKNGKKSYLTELKSN